MGPETPEFPNAAEEDSDDVRWALETAGAMWSQGDAKEALRWLKKAADTASEEGADMRSLSLAKIAADLRSAADERVSEGAPAPRPPSAAPSVVPAPATASVPAPAAATPSTLPQARRPVPPPPKKSVLPPKRALPAPTRGKSATPEPPEPSVAPPAVKAPPRGQAPPPAASASAKSTPGRDDNRRQPAKTVRMDRTPKPGDAIESAPGAAPPSFGGADSIPDSGKTTVSAHPAGAAPASAAPASAAPASAAPASAAPASAAPASAAPVSAAPVSAAPVSAAPVSAAPVSAAPASIPPLSSIPGPESAPYEPGFRSEPPNSLGDRPTLVKPLSRDEIDAYYQQPPPSVEVTPIDPGTTAVIHHQAVRVSIHPLQDQPGVFLTHILSEGEPAPRGTSEALLVALDPRIKLIQD